MLHVTILELDKFHVTSFILIEIFILSCLNEGFLFITYKQSVLIVFACVTYYFDRYDLLHNAHLNLEGLDELFNVAQVHMQLNHAIHLSLAR